jgi:DNA-binding Lrp family transcriptional regulator
MTMKNGKAARGTMEEIAKTSEPTALERRLLDDFQRDFPLEPLPFAEVAAQVGSDQATVIAALRRLTAEGHVSRVGAVVAPHAVGWSTLAAMAVPEARLEAVAALVNGYPEVNHNYEREHRLNGSWSRPRTRRPWPPFCGTSRHAAVSRSSTCRSSNLSGSIWDLRCDGRDRQRPAADRRAERGLAAGA